MTRLFFEGTPVPMAPNESVLDALLRAGHDIPFGCKSGACQSCMLQVQSGQVPPQSQPGLSDSMKQLGYFLSCSCYPTGEPELHVQSSEEGQVKIPAVVSEKSFIGKDILRLRLSASIYYRPGQYLTLWKDDKLARSYSIASVATLQPDLEFHIKHIANGAFSAWAARDLEQGDILYLTGPMGTCFYTPSTPEQRLLLAGIGTGLAPLYAIARDALMQQHSGEIDLYVGAKNSENFYYIDALKELEASHGNLHVHFISQQITDSSPAELIQGDLYQIIKQQHPSMKNYKIFLCGAESFVKKLKKQCFLAGANMNDILADTFLPSGV